MRIEVVVNKGDFQKKRGDLLESMAKDFLLLQNYEVDTELRKTGMELDLLCKLKANLAKKIYVECKAYSENNKIQADVIKNLVGIRTIHGYQEAWLISTSEFGKDAKGLVDEMEQKQDSAFFTFYTPQKLIQAFIDSKIIKGDDVIKNNASHIVADSRAIGDMTLLITERGYFWIIEFKKGGAPTGVLVFCANTGDIVGERKLLDFLSNTDSSLKNLNFFEIFTFSKENIDPASIVPEDLKLNKKYLNRSNVLYVGLKHPKKNELELSDIFVYPDLEYVEDKETKKLNASELPNVIKENKRCLIFGEEVSGKTCLAINLQKNFNKDGIISLYLDAVDIKYSNQKKFLELVIKTFKEQYSNEKVLLSAFSRFILENKNKIVLLIDNLDLISIRNQEDKASFFTTLNQMFDNVVFFANKSMELELTFKDTIKTQLLNPKPLRIKWMGHVLRDELIEKWLLINQDEHTVDADYLGKKDDISRKIESLVGARFIPTYPIYLLTLLQVIQEGDKERFQGSSYAEFYRYLINHTLVKSGSRPDDLDFYHTYLSYIAHSLFVRGKKELKQSELGGLYSEYVKRMHIEKDFDTVHLLLTSAKLLKYEQGAYVFSHPYGYYFFVAKYLSDNMDDLEINKEIDEITTKLFRDEFSNIALFLVHHARSQRIIDKILNESKKVLENVAPLTLSADELFVFNNLIAEEISLSIEDKNPKEHRKNELEHKDRINEVPKNEEGEGEKDELEKLDLFERINLSFKLMEILGQITKNHHGSMEGEKKVAIIEEVHFLGFKSLKILLDDFNKYSDLIKEEVKKLVGSKNSLPDIDKEKLADTLIFTFVESVIVAFVKKISDSFASKNLLVSSQKLVEKHGTPSAKLVDVAMRLNFPHQLNIEMLAGLEKELKGNHVSRTLLRILVIEHLYKFEVPFRDKQSVCGQLGIDMKQDRKLFLKDGKL